MLLVRNVGHCSSNDSLSTYSWHNVYNERRLTQILCRRQTVSDYILPERPACLNVNDHIVSFVFGHDHR